MLSETERQLVAARSIIRVGRLWGAPEGPDESLRTDETVRFWEHDLPLRMTGLATQLEPGHRFNSIVVDEAQDFADAWCDPLQDPRLLDLHGVRIRVVRPPHDRVVRPPRAAIH